MRHFSNSERGQIAGVRLAGASVTKTATLLGVSRAKVSKVMSAFTNHAKTSSAKRNSGRKSTPTERDRRTLRRVVSKKKSQDYCSTGDSSKTEYSSWDRCFH
jgi:predicted transcriptional regulator